MTEEQRDQILELTEYNYNCVGCTFKLKGRDLIEYIYDSHHPDEHRCLIMAIQAYNIFNRDTMTEDEFFDWHGL